jgi:hypothetical protein
VCSINITNGSLNFKSLLKGSVEFWSKVAEYTQYHRIVVGTVSTFHRTQCQRYTFCQAVEDGYQRRLRANFLAASFVLPPSESTGTGAISYKKQLARRAACPAVANPVSCFAVYISLLRGHKLGVVCGSSP